MRVLFISFLLVSLTTALAQKTERYVQAGGFRVHCTTQGNGPAVVFLHAGLQNSTMWAEQVKALSPSFTVVTLDLPYHGQTTGVDTSILAADVVRTVLDSLHFSRVALVGLSMGAAVAQDVAIAYSERISKLVLLASGINGLEKHQAIDSVSLALFNRFPKALEQKDTARAAYEFARAWGEGIHAKGTVLRKPAAQWVQRTTLATLQKHKLRGWVRLQSNPPAYENLQRLTMPVLIVHGNEDLPFIGTACRYLERTLPAAKRIELKGVAHMLNLEQPVEVNRLLLTFLRQQEQ